jgi:hypothetical protein
MTDFWRFSIEFFISLTLACRLLIGSTRILLFTARLSARLVCCFHTPWLNRCEELLFKIGFNWLYHCGHSIDHRFSFASCIDFLIHLHFDLAHSFSFFSAEPLPLLIPAPLVDLALAQPRVNTQLSKCVLRPIWVIIEHYAQGVELVRRFALATPDDPGHAAGDWIQCIPSFQLGDGLFTRDINLYDFL